MPKIKGHKGWRKRAKVTARGKVKFHRRGKTHLLSNKSGRHRQALRRTATLHDAFAQAVVERLPR